MQAYNNEILLWQKNRTCYKNHESQNKYIVYLPVK